MHSVESKEKIRNAHKGSNAYNYKGDSVGYTGLHSWVKRWLGKASHCEFCGIENLSRYEWAAKNGMYVRNLDNWISLCKKCHMKYDNTGVKIWKTRRTRVYEKHIPWNKGLVFVKSIKCKVCEKEFKPAKKTRLFCSNSCSMKNKMKLRFNK